jgi:Zn-dependent M28 family amino/carboxypeptidase
MTLRVIGRAIVAAGLAWCSAVAAQGPELGLPAGATVAMQSIDANRISAHVRFLASDLLEGRGTGTRGGQLAAEYIATQFALYGLKPAGDDGSYLQKLRFIGSHTESSTSAGFAPDGAEATPLKLYEDVVTTNQTGSDSVDIDAPITFVGYGIEAPEFNWDDYKDVDVRGKMVLVIVNEPPSDDPRFFKGPALTYYGRWTYKFEEAARKGAVGALIIHRTDLASYPWDVVKSSWSNEQVYLADDQRPRLQAASWIQLEVARVLFAASGRNLDEMLTAAGQRGFKAIDLPVRFKAHILSKVRRFESDNVVAMLPGADSKQAVLYTAHYDHLGIDPSMPGDNIYNGAVDNGTGCGILLELARAFAGNKDRPPHPVLFAAVTAEEKGLLGSEYLGKHPPLPASQIALDLNYDAVAPLGVPEGVEVSGAERTSFYPTVEKTAKAFHFEIEPDATPSAGHYYRSDHFSLARVGVPAFTINAGIKYAGHPREWGLEQHKDYVANRYHRPADEWTPEQDYTSNALVARFGFALGWQALSQGTVNWLPGDEFEAARRNEKAAP